jgi:hypothetical protein
MRSDPYGANVIALESAPDLDNANEGKYFIFETAYPYRYAVFVITNDKREDGYL